MKVITSIAAMLCVASSALAEWTYDPQTKQASDGNWILQLHPMPSGGGLQLGNSNNSGSAIVQMPEDRNLDLSTFHANTGYKIYGIYPNGFRGTHIASLIAPDVTNINNDAFNSCTNLTRLVFSDNLSGAGNSAFYNCSRLVEFSPAVCPISTVSQYLFQYCRKLEIDFVFPRATSIGGSAFHSSGVKSVHAERATSIGGSAFRNSGVTSVHAERATSISASAFYSSGVTNVHAENVTSLGDQAFRESKNLKSANFPRCLTIGSTCFRECSGLTNAVFSSDMTSFGSGGNEFYLCSALKSFTPYLSDKITSMGGGSTFNGCSKLAGSLSIKSPQLKTICHSAFLGAAKNFIGAVEISSPIATIGKNAFKGCKDLQVFDFYSDVAPTTIGTDAFTTQSYKTIKVGVIINVHSSKALEGWRTRCAAYSEKFEEMKSNASYPGKKTIGVFECGESSPQYHWVVDCSPPKGTSIVIL